MWLYTCMLSDMIPHMFFLISMISTRKTHIFESRIWSQNFGTFDTVHQQSGFGSYDKKLAVRTSIKHFDSIFIIWKTIGNWVKISNCTKVMIYFSTVIKILLITSCFTFTEKVTFMFYYFNNNAKLCFSYTNITFYKFKLSYLFLKLSNSGRKTNCKII